MGKPHFGLLRGKKALSPTPAKNYRAFSLKHVSKPSIVPSLHALPLSFFFLEPKTSQFSQSRGLLTGPASAASSERPIPPWVFLVKRGRTQLQLHNCNSLLPSRVVWLEKRQHPYRQTSSPSIASCSSVLANETLPPITAPII